MFVVFFLFSVFVYSIAPKSLYFSDRQKVEFLQELFRCYRDRLLCIDCHAFSGILPDKGNNIYQNYDLKASYHVRGSQLKKSIQSIEELGIPEDYSVIAIFAGDNVENMETCHSYIYYKGFVIEKCGSEGGLEVTKFETCKYEKWINRREHYFYYLKTFYNLERFFMYKYIVLNVLVPKKFWLETRIQYSPFLDFILKEDLRLNQLLSYAYPILKKYSHRRSFLRKGFLVGWKELLDQGVVQKIFPEIDVGILHSSLDEHEKIELLRRGNFVLGEHQLVVYVRKTIEQYS